ncbi:hypothetical protein PPL_08076 [Heterostelium album PN500]|uniref:Uncharacterized protein n=1 Tax=Heterostelium pallidum (strain ATCC 26659 / Pp 5 / PN500) TaxID=670386 RepID=D3BIJ7_HETP5|nr:hypothetical protein PPL_08076 [Heterostelium album PN500]EFA78621.1 hypothetical protein PPL_08076 [Heterostelium album PN500]|eukprot:XP_020430745.1 hypothetical protein PPL_08076 [Heterostelium album PN500]
MNISKPTSFYIQQQQQQQQHSSKTASQSVDSIKQKNQQQQSNEKLIAKQRLLFSTVYAEPLKKIEHNINVLIQCGSIDTSLQPTTQYDSFELFEFSGDSILAKEFSDRTTKYPGASPYICTLFKSHGCSNDTLTFFYHLLHISSKLLDVPPTIPKKQADIMEAMIHELYHAQNNIARSTLEMFILVLLQYTNITFHHSDPKLCAEVSAINNNALLNLFDNDSYLKSISLASMIAVPTPTPLPSVPLTVPLAVPLAVPLPTLDSSFATSLKQQQQQQQTTKSVVFDIKPKMAPVSLNFKLESLLETNTTHTSKSMVITGDQKQSKIVNMITDPQNTLLSPYTLGFQSSHTQPISY